MQGLKRTSNGLRSSVKRLDSDITVMVDANCAFQLSIEEARAFLPALQASNIFWFEEPIHSHDYRGHKALRETAQDYGIQYRHTGENGYGLHYFQTLIDYDGADVFNLDVAILPGYEPAMQSRRRSIESRKVDRSARGARAANPRRCKSR